MNLKGSVILLIAILAVLAACNQNVLCEHGSDGGGGDGGSIAIGGAGGGNGGEGGEDACTPTLRAEYLMRAMNTIQVESELDYGILSLSITANSCADQITIKGYSFELITLEGTPGDKSPFCAEPCEAPSDWNFRDLMSLTSVVSERMGPAQLYSATPDQMARVDFTGTMVIPSCGTKLITLSTKIAKPAVTQIDGVQYAARFIGLTTDDPEVTVEIVDNIKQTYFMIE